MNCQAITPCGPPNWIALPWVPFLALLLAAGAHPAHGAGIVGSGTRESCTEAALDAALDGGGLVTFDCGAEPVTIILTAEKVITEDMDETIVNGGGLVTLSGGGAVRVFRVDESGVLDVRNLTIADGRAPGDLSVDQYALGLGDGGGIVNDGTLTVTNCTFSGNHTSGGVAGVGGGGAGIANGGTLTVTNSTFSGNMAPSNSGGGIANSGNLIVAKSTFRGNYGSLGGGISNGGAASISNSTLTANSAYGPAHLIGPGDGGGILNDGTLELSSCTITGNSADDVDGVSHYGGSLTIENTIIANHAVDCAGTVADGGHNLIEGEHSCGLVDGVNGNIVGVDPLLDPAGLADNGGLMQTIALLPGSPAIDAGDPAVCANPPVNGLDQRGYVRPGVGHTQCSIGAYEADAIPVAACVGDCDSDGTVAVDELILGVDIALGEQPVGACPAFWDADGVVDIAQLITGVNNALDGCAAG